MCKDNFVSDFAMLDCFSLYGLVVLFRTDFYWKSSGGAREEGC